MGVRLCTGNMFELWNYKIGLQELKVKRNEANEVYVRNVRKKKWLTCTITCMTAHSTASYNTSKKDLNFFTTLRFTVNYWGGNKSLCEPSKQQKTSASTYYWTMQNVLEIPSLILLSRTSFILPSRHVPKKKNTSTFIFLFQCTGRGQKRTVHVYKDVNRVPQCLKSIPKAAAQVLSGYTKRCTVDTIYRHCRCL